MRAAWIVGLGLVGCSGEPVSWDLDRPADRVSDLVRALFLLPGVDARDELVGPHAAGSTVKVRARRKGLGAIDGWTFDVVPEGAATVTVEGMQGEHMVLTLRLDEPGEVTLQARNPMGGVRDEVVFDVREVASATLRTYEDVLTVRSEEASSEGVLRIVEGGAASLLVSWRDSGGELLTGRGLASYALDAQDQLLSVNATAYERDNVEAFTLRAGALPAPGLPDEDTDALDTDALDTDGEDTDARAPSEPGPAIRRALAVQAGDRPVGVWTVEVVPASDIALMDIAYHVDEEALAAAEDLDRTDPDAAATRTIGWARARARDVRAQRVLAPPTRWLDGGREVSGQGALVSLVLGEPSQVDACVLTTDVCSRSTLPASLGLARDPVISCGGCASGAGLGAGAMVLLVGAGLVRRRG